MTTATDPFAGGRGALGGSTVALACHVNPDADALGSMLGLSNLLRARGTQTVCSFPNEPFEPPRWAAMLPGTEALVPPSAFPKDPAVMVTCDVASLDRLASLGGPAARATTLIWIDHHVSNEGLGTIPLIDPSASSTCEMVWRLLKVLGGEIRSRPRCACTPGSSPTPGGSSTRRSGRTRSASRRSSASSRSTTPGSCRRSTRTTGSRTCELLGVALERVRVEPDADLVWTYLTQADLDGADLDPGEADDLIDVVRTAREADVAAVVKQQRDGRFKVSLRSRGGHDVAAAAASFGGGGHRLASGYTSSQG